MAIRDRFRSKVAVVTGGASGIGNAPAQGLLKEGAASLFTDPSDSGDQVAAAWREAGCDVRFS
jgi:NAD(P)-dependent dehydrogenase (short-subunit alcohol dehydrogenase family)